jgi:hypothetical protein
MPRPEYVSESLIRDTRTYLTNAEVGR